MIVNALKLFFSACLFFVEGFAVYRLLGSNILLSKKKIIISCVCWILVCLVAYQPIYSSVAQIVMFITLALAFSYVFQISLIKAFVSTGIVHLTVALGDSIGALTLSLFLELNQIRESILFLLIGNIFVIMFTFLLSLMPFYKKKLGSFLSKINYNNEKRVILYVLLAIIFISVIDLKLTSEQLLYLNDMLVVLIPIMILFVLLILYIFERNKYQTLNSQYEALFTHATSLESWLENERLSYHEYKNQLAYIRSIVEEKEAIAYIDSILQESFENSAIIDTQIANIPKGGMKGLIFYKLIQAQRKGIDSYVSISPKMSSLSVGKDIEKSKTVCRIFGILLDNAIDAAAESDKRRISLEMYRLDQKLIFVVMNTFKGDVNVAKIQEKGYTTKGKGHGNGLNYVKNIIARDNRYTLQTSLIGGYYTQKVTIEE